MTFWLNALYVFLVMLPLVFEGIITTYFVDGVLKYEVRHKRLVYLILALIGAGYGAAKALIGFGSEDDMIIINDIEAFAIMAVTIISLAVFIKAKWWKKIVVAFLAFDIIMAVNEIFSTLSDQIVFTFSWSSQVAIMAFFVLFNLLILLLEFAFLYVLKRLRDKSDNTPLPISVMLTIAVLLNVFISMFPDLLEDADNTDSKRVMTILGMIMILLFMALFFYIRVTKKERDDLKDLNHVNEELVASQAKFFETTAKSDNEIRAMRHDMRNNIQVLKLLLENGDYDKMREYLDEMGDNLVSADVSAHTGDTIADAIIADKTAKAEDCGVKLKCSGKITGVEISPVDMCKILANLLDNAIEAASVPELSEIGDPLRTIELQFRKTDNFFMISVTNPCAVAPEINDGKIQTSKKDRKNHGFGIHNIENAASGYGGELTVDCEEKPYGFLFRAEVVFPTSSIE
jgi:signal transduction histidine kinase